jgi:hypothetical protein
VDNVSFTVVDSKHRRGRPTTVSTANTSGIPDIASLQIPSTQANSSLNSLGDKTIAETLDNKTIAKTLNNKAMANISENA